MKDNIKKEVAKALRIFENYSSSPKEEVQYLKSLISLKNEVLSSGNFTISISNINKTLSRFVEVKKFDNFNEDALIHAIDDGDKLASFNLAKHVLAKELRTIQEAYQKDMSIYQSNKNKNKVMSFKEVFKAIDQSKRILYV